MNFKSLATQILMNNIESANNSSQAGAALDKLVGTTRGFELEEIVIKFQGSGGELAGLAESWLGDGANRKISAFQVKQALGSARVAAFANALGISGEEAGQRLAQILPELIDKSSQGGDLISRIGNKGFLAGFASRVLRKSA